MKGEALTKDCQIIVRVPRGLHRAATAKADREERTLSDVVRFALRAYLADELVKDGEG